MTTERSSAKARRITLVADELRGLGGGGIGSGTAFLAVALGRAGHDVEVLYVGPGATDALVPEWARLYDGSGVRVRALRRTERAVEPAYFARLRDVDEALAADPPDVVVTQDLAAPAYTALRLRQAGLAFENTLFVVYCHGTRRWITDMARKVHVLPGAMGVGVLEQASIELADVAVSPSAYMLEWMRREGWSLPGDSRVIPLLTRSAATGEPPPPRADAGAPVRRIVFFGRLEERKGVRPFAAGLNALEPELLAGVELEFVGPPTAAWPPERVGALLAASTRQALSRIAFEPALDQQEALARLSHPGTLAIMPSLEDNSPATVYECLERGIPFLASNAGGTGELVAEIERSRVLFEPTADGVASAVRDALESREPLRPAQPAFEPKAAVERWLDVVAMSRPAPAKLSGNQATVETVAVVRSERRALPEQSSEWVLFLNPTDVADERLVDVLVHAQQATGADVVTCGIELETDNGTHEQYFAGDPGSLGLLENGYGTVALIRRALLTHDIGDAAAADDPTWPLLARLTLAGAKTVSVPLPLVRRSRQPGKLGRDPAAALVVAGEMERRLPEQLRLLPRLAGGLAVVSETPAGASPAYTQRFRDRLAALVAR